MGTATTPAPIDRRGVPASTPPRERRHGAGLRIARIAGIDVHADWSLLVIFSIVAVQLGVGVLPHWHPDWRPALVWSTALLAAFLFFASIVAHELSHALVARVFGVTVKRITLFLFGGVAHLEEEPRSPKAELAIAAIGPIVSFAIGVGAIVLGFVVAGDQLAGIPFDPERAYRDLGPFPTLLLWLGPINVMLAIFNLVPGFPLDGGRVLRAVLWWWTGDSRRATRWASNAGVFWATVLMAFGAISMLGGSFASGLWLLLIGWFLRNAARGAYQQMLVTEALRDVSAESVMQRRVETVTPVTSIDELVHGHLMATEQLAFPVLAGERLVGIVCVSDIRKIPRADWPTTSVGQAMTPIDRLVTLAPDAPANEALEKLARFEIDQIPVVDGRGALLGMLRRRDIMKWIAVSEPAIQR